jgi:hypothetical protein
VGSAPGGVLLFPSFPVIEHGGRDSDERGAAEECRKER